MFANTLQNNIWKYTVHMVTNKRTYMTFLTIFLLTMPNATARTIGILTALGQIVGFLFEVPSGYISDRIGHRNALIFARVMMVLSTLCYVLADNKWWFFAGAIFLAIGWAFVSGTGSAFMHDTLTALKKDHRFAHIMGRIKSMGFAVPIIFIVLLPIIAEQNFRVAFLVALVIDIIGLMAVIIMTQPKVSVAVKEVSIHNFKQTLYRWYTIGWFRYVLTGLIVFGITFAASAGFKNPYQELVGFSISALGILWAMSRVFISLSLLVNGWVYERLTFKQFIVIRTGLQAAGFVIVGLASNMWVIAGFFIFVTALKWGFTSTQDQYLFGFMNASDSKATLLSVTRLFQNIVTALYGLAMGFMVAGYSYSLAYFVTGIVLVATTIIAIISLPNSQKEAVK